MVRREFLRRSVLGGLAVGGCGAVLRGADAAGEGAKPAESKVASRLPGAKLRLSLAAYSFRQLLSGQNPSMSLEEFVDLCAREGLEGTELTSYYFRRTDPEYLYSLRRRAYVNGLTISGTPVGNNFCVPPGDKRDKELAHVKSWIDHVAMLGSQTIRVFAGSAPKDQSEADVKAWAVDCLKQVSDYAGKRGVLLGLENHGGITSTVEQLLGLVAAVDSPWLGVNLDTGNFHERVYESIEAAAPYAVAVQVKVEVSERGKAKEEADLARIVRILRGAGYRGFVALEYEAAEDPRQAVPRWLGRLREAAASER